MNLKAWLKQPTTIHGLAALATTAIGIGTYFATRNVALAAGFAGSTFGVICTALNDNSNDPSAIERLVTDAATAITQRKLATMLPQLIGDVQSAITVQATPAAPVAVVVTPPVATPGA